MAIAAAVSLGASLPGEDGDGVPGDVLLASYEDGPEDTIRPRLDKQRADVSRVHVIDQCFHGDGAPRTFSHLDIPNLEEALTKLGNPRLLIVDPVVSYMGGQVDTNKDNQIRSGLQELVGLAARQRIALLGVCI
jgi:hypothetical protein